MDAAAIVTQRASPPTMASPGPGQRPEVRVATSARSPCTPHAGTRVAPCPTAPLTTSTGMIVPMARSVVDRPGLAFGRRLVHAQVAGLDAVGEEGRGLELPDGDQRRGGQGGGAHGRDEEGDQGGGDLRGPGGGEGLAQHQQDLHSDSTCPERSITNGSWVAMTTVLATPPSSVPPAVSASLCPCC